MDFFKKTINWRVLTGKYHPRVVTLILREILCSKRMLVDHIEVLEQCQAILPDYVEPSTNEAYRIFFVGGVLLIPLVAVSIKMNIKSLRYLYSTIATSYGCCFVMKIFFLMKDKIYQRRLNETIKSIKAADMVMCKNVSFLREVKFSSNSDERYHNQSQICLESIINIIQVLYAEVKVLDSIKLPEHIEIEYQPLEDLSSCVYFQENTETVTKEHLKMCYNIFLYFQSQFCLRLYLTLFFKPEYGLENLNDVCIRLPKSLQVNVEKMDSWLGPTQQEIYVPKNSGQFKSEVNKDFELSKMKRTSTDILCCLIAIANKFQCIDVRIQSLERNSPMIKEEIMIFSKEIDEIQASIKSCHDDFKVLNLINNELFLQKFQRPKENDDTVSEIITTNLSSSSKRVEGIESIQEEDKEYFSIRDVSTCLDTCIDNDSYSPSRVSRGQRSTLNYVDEIDINDVKRTRLSFAPVLKQLKLKIDPIKSQMKEREIAFLLSRGINRERIINFDKNEETQVHLPDPDGMNNSKSQSKCVNTRFEESRSFLQQKKFITIIPLNIPRAFNQEDILE